MKRAALALLLVVPALLVAAPADAARDVPGWQNTTWGMTEPEVRRALESSKLRTVPVRSADVPFKVRMPVEGAEADVTFHFIDDPRRLDRVLVERREDPRARAIELHGKLLQSLTAAYGQPTDTISRGTTASMTRWRFKSTTIALSFYTDTGAPGRHTTRVSVMYASALNPSNGDDKQPLFALGLLRLFGEAWPPR